MQNNIKIESDSEPESKRKNIHENVLDAEDPELIAAEILFKNTSKNENNNGDDQNSTRSGG